MDPVVKHVDVLNCLKVAVFYIYHIYIYIFIHTYALHINTGSAFTFGVEVMFSLKSF